MDPEEGLALTGGFFAELFGVEDGWAHFDANFANEEGETSKAKFDELVACVVTKFTPVITEMASPAIKEAYVNIFGYSPTDSRIEKDVSLLVKKIPCYLPVITNALFRFFDQDGSGTISKEEVVIAFGSLFAGPGGGPNMRLFVPAVFRMIDENQNGSIEAVEVQPLLTEVITSVAKVVLSIIDVFEKDIKVGLKHKALKKIQTMVDGAVAEGMLYPVPSDSMIKRLAEHPIREVDLVGFTKIDQTLTPEIIDGYNAFADRFKAVSQGNPVPIKKAAALLADTVVGPICAFADPDLAAAMLPMVTAGMALPIPLEMLDLGDALNSGCAVVSAYLKSGGVKRFFEALLNFLDVNNDGEITWEELNSLWAAVIGLKEANMDQEKAQAAVLDLFSAFLKILDSDGSGCFDMDDAPKLYDKAAELIVSVMCLSVELTKSVTVAMILPMLNIAFQMFTEDGSITTEMVEAILG